MMLRRVLKKVGLVLILLPEPFTTPLGVVLLGASYVFSRFDRVDSARQLRGFMNLYFKHARPVGQTGKIIQHKLKERLTDYEWRFQPGLPEKDVRTNMEISRLILRYAETMSNPPAEAKIVHHSLRWDGYVLPESSRSIDAVQKTVIHKIDDSRLALRFSDMAGGSARGTVADKVIFHNLKSSSSGYVLPSQPQKKVISHSLGTAKLCPAPVRAW